MEDDAGWPMNQPVCLFARFNPFDVCSIEAVLSHINGRPSLLPFEYLGAAGGPGEHFGNQSGAMQHGVGPQCVRVASFVRQGFSGETAPRKFARVNPMIFAAAAGLNYKNMWPCNGIAGCTKDRVTDCYSRFDGRGALSGNRIWQ